MLDEKIAIPSKAIEVDEAQIHEPEPIITGVEEITAINSNIDEVPVKNIDLVTNIDLVPTVNLSINPEDVLEVNDSNKESNSLPRSTPTHDIPTQNIEVSNISEECHPKKVTEEESKPGKYLFLNFV